MEKLNVYFVVSHPIQYFVPLYKHLALKDSIRTRVLFLSDETLKESVDKQFGVKFTWDIPLLEGYEYTFIKNKSLKPSLFNGFWGLFNPGIINELRRLPRGMVVISGWHFSTYIITYFFAFVFGHKVAIRCEAPAYKEEGRKGLKNIIRGFLLGRILLNGLVDKCLYLGRQNKSFYKYYRVDEERLEFTPYTIDNARFKEGLKKFDRSTERALLKISKDDFVVLFTGKFIPVKRPMDLLIAFHNLDLPDKKLVLVGDGILKEEMQSYITRYQMKDVYFTGFINQTELPKFYSIADVLVLCSESETWGLSVNEAMACGMPVIVSDRVGCADDLVENGANGYIVPKGDVAELSHALKKVSEHIQNGNLMGLESERIIGGYTLERTAEGIIRAVQDSLR